MLLLVSYFYIVNVHIINIEEQKLHLRIYRRFRLIFHYILKLKFSQKNDSVYISPDNVRKPITTLSSYHYNTEQFLVVSQSNTPEDNQHQELLNGRLVSEFPLLLPQSLYSFLLLS